MLFGTPALTASTGRTCDASSVTTAAVCPSNATNSISPAELARKVGTTQSVISRLEDADYDGHSLEMLRRIASALEKRVEIRFLPSRKLQHA